MIRWLLAGTIVLALSVSMIRCGEPDAEYDGRRFLVVVESSLREDLSESLEQYRRDVEELEGMTVDIEEWEDGTVDDLRGLLFAQVDLDGIEGALLIGDLPYARFEQEGLPADDRSFPTDIYLQDGDAVWIDTNYNGVDDYHTPLELDIYTSRLIGTVEQLRRYFERVHRYRREGSLLEPTALIFIDNDWADMDTSDFLQLNRLYSVIDVVQAPDESSSKNYFAKLTGDGVEFVFQKFHTGPRVLMFDDLDDEGQPVINKLPIELVPALKVSFLNLTNCEAARFSTPGDSLGQVYTVGTDYGLAIIGSTKVGGMIDSDLFHSKLADGMRWGEAYQAWFNEEGKSSDKWHMGILLMGDPLLKVNGDVNVPREE